MPNNSMDGGAACVHYLDVVVSRDKVLKFSQSLEIRRRGKKRSQKFQPTLKIGSDA